MSQMNTKATEREREKKHRCRNLEMLLDHTHSLAKSGFESTLLFWKHKNINMTLNKCMLQVHMYTFTFSELFLILPKIYTMLGWVQQVNDIAVCLFFGCRLRGIIFFSNGTNHLFEIECNAIIFIRLRRRKKKNRAIAYGGCVICGHKITMVWLLTPAAVVQRSSEISEREPSLQRPARLVLGVWWVRGVGQASLPFAHVPVQALGQALEPIVNQVVATDGGHRVAGCGDLDAAGDKWQRQGSGARKETAVDCNGRMVTSPQTGSPVSSCRQTTPRQCSWPRGTGWSNGDGGGRRSQSRPTDRRRHADFPTRTVGFSETLHRREHFCGD